MKNKIIALVLVILSLSAFGFDIPKSPNPPRLVNDYIRLLSPMDAQALEKKLVEFNNKTSIQIAVVILDDLDNAEASDVAPEILHQWGVGQKGLDNGIVFLVVKYNQNAIEKLFTQKHGDWFITPGYGLEPYITDADVKSIGDSQFIPFAKEDKYYEGIDATVSAIITKLGDIGWQQREEFEAKRKAEEAENLRKFGNGLLHVVSFGLIIGLLFWLFVSIRKKVIKAKELNRKKNEVKINFETKKNQYLELKKKYDEICQEVDRVNVYPTWAIEKYQTIIAKIPQDLKFESVKGLFAIFNQSNDLEEMNGLLKTVVAYISLLQSVVKGINSIDEEIKKYRTEAPLKIQSAKDLLVSLNTKITDFAGKQYKVPEYGIQAKDFQKKIEGMESILQSEPNQDLMLFEGATELIVHISETIKKLDTILTDKAEAEKIIKELNAEIPNLPTKIEQTQTILDELKANYPQSNWFMVNKCFGKVSNFLMTGKRYLEHALERGTMEIQDFATAKDFAERAQKNIEYISMCCNQVEAKKNEIEHAKNEFNALLVITQTKIEQAKAKISHTDVKEDTKSLYVSAQSSVKEATSKAKETKVDWLTVIDCLTTAGTLADKASMGAETDIQKAEKKRQDDADAIKTAAAAALLATQRRNQEDDYYHSDTTSSDDSFGGFGGGDGGGGGAGGSW